MNGWCFASLCGFLVFSAGCGPFAKAPDVVIRGRDDSIKLLKPVDESPDRDGTDDVLQMVSESLVHIGGEELTVEQWVQRQTDGSAGQVMFPRWDVRRRGTHMYEVRFTYTLLYDDYRVEKRGYSWQVDPILRLVGAPVVLDPEELERQSGFHDISGTAPRGGEGLFRLE